MKTFYLTVLALAQFLFAVAQEETKEVSQEEGITISVKIDNVKNNTGTVYFSLHTKDTFMRSDGVQKVQSKIKDNKVNVTFTNVPKGTYAITCVHDENNNGRMDFDEGGMPKEDYGMSNNPMSYGPPEFGPSKFMVKDSDLNLKILL